MSGLTARATTDIPADHFQYLASFPIISLSSGFDLELKRAPEPYRIAVRISFFFC